MKSIWDNIRGLDYLCTLPFVRTNGFGAIGHSLGGHNSVFTAVFEERIKVVISSCGLDSFVDYYGGDPKVWQPERGWCQVRYMPALTNYAGRLLEIPFDFPELIGALTPRSCLVSAPIGDTIPALWTAYGITLALRQREQTGAGQFLDIAMYDTMANGSKLLLQPGRFIENRSD
jgi:hypothetical protein